MHIKAACANGQWLHEQPHKDPAHKVLEGANSKQWAVQVMGSTEGEVRCREFKGWFWGMRGSQWHNESYSFFPAQTYSLQPLLILITN